jgi:hypothetical protein
MGHILTRKGKEVYREGNLKERGSLEDLDVDESITLK